MFSSILHSVVMRNNHRILFTRLGRRGLTQLRAPQILDMFDALPVERTRAANGDLILVYDKTPDIPKRYYRAWNFVEEPCGFSVKQGLGFMQVEFGERIGPDGRYEILRKLGWGMQSNIWLAKDTVQSRFVAIKALTGYMTEQVKEGRLAERDVLRRLRLLGNGWKDTDTPFLLDEFVQPGKNEWEGKHLCLVTDPFGPSLSILRSSGYVFTKPIIKRILLQMLNGLDHLRRAGIAYTDLTLSNILVALEADTEHFDIESFIKEHPAERHPPEYSWLGSHVRVAKSQPLFSPTLASWKTPNFVISDFGLAQFLDNKITEEIVRPDQLAPETILGLPWDEKVDVWSFGCLVFRLINDRDLLKTSLGNLPWKLAVLYQILLITEELLPPETIRSSPLAKKYLNPETGWLNVLLPPLNMEPCNTLKQTGILTESKDVEGVTALMKKCLRLDPKDRASVKDLLRDPWLNEEA